MEEDTSITKEEFVQSQNAPAEIAREAWEEADGDVSSARQLLMPSELSVQATFHNEDNTICGAFLLKWNHAKSEIIKLRSTVVNDEMDNLEATNSEGQFLGKLKQVSDSPKLMSGYSEELDECLRTLWKEISQKLVPAIAESNKDKFESLHVTALERDLGFSGINLNTEVDYVRTLDELDENKNSDTDADQQESVTIPNCEAEVTPVNGVSVENLNIGDYIYIEPGNMDEWPEIKSQIEKIQDEDGLITAQLSSISQMSEDRAHLEVQISEDVYGELKCRSDVTLKVPDETLKEHDSEEEPEFDEVLTPEILLLASASVVIVIILILLYFLQ